MDVSLAGSALPLALLMSSGLMMKKIVQLSNTKKTARSVISV
jgi:hypothetical protein